MKIGQTWAWKNGDQWVGVKVVELEYGEGWWMSTSQAIKTQDLRVYTIWTTRTPEISPNWKLIEDVP